jgi:two-component system sensor histidine kinase ArlS
MNYKSRLTFLFAGLFLVVIISILAFIYIFYAEFRRDEFFERLREKCLTTASLLVEVKESDQHLLKVIDQNSIHKMYDEKVLVFNNKNTLIYSSLDDKTISYSTAVINEIRKKKEIFYVDDDDDEVVGLHYQNEAYDYVVLASAYDRYGISKLQKLKNILAGAMLLSTLLIAMSSYFYINQVFKPIDELNKSIQAINEKNMRAFIPVKKNKDELDKLAHNYNQMLSRLFKAFESQRAFVRNASHELKTPLALILGKLESLVEMAKDNDKMLLILNRMMDDVKEQASLIESLLLIQRLQSEVPLNASAVRVDEILFECMRETNVNFPELKVEVDIQSPIIRDNQLTVLCNAMLLKTCFRNLIENAALYSEKKDLSIEISEFDSQVRITFLNSGEESLSGDQIFEPFFRETKEQEKPGNGLGLSIVKQIVDLIKGKVEYRFQNQKHCFYITIPHS